MTEPKTLAEQLDAAAAVDDDGVSFGGVLQGLFGVLEQARDEEQQ